MKRGFYTIMSAQFFSSLADNALFVAAVELLKTSGGSEWQRAALVPMFALFYVVLAPLLGAFADAVPKGKVMFLANGIKVVGCLMMLLGGHPLISYAVVGLGAAAYSPAKYGILTELLPPSQLVKANGWIEGLTILSIILGVGLGGLLIGPRLAPLLLSIDVPFIDTGINTAPAAAIACMVVLYAIAALFNLRIPRTDVELLPITGQFGELVRDFSQCNARLWADRLGQISLATTTLFWGASANLRYIVLPWAAIALHMATDKAALMLIAVALGTAVGAIVAAVRMRLDRATRVISLGIAMGLVLVAMNAVHTVPVAGVMLAILGVVGGYVVVPMNALLQHRGQNLMGSGRSIAVQNFNEQACILGMGAIYSALTKGGLSPFGAITLFGLTVAVLTWAIARWHRYNLRQHREEVEALLAIARTDCH